jgi:hypothetical protein
MTNFKRILRGELYLLQKAILAFYCNMILKVYQIQDTYLGHWSAVATIDNDKIVNQPKVV